MGVIYFDESGDPGMVLRKGTGSGSSELLVLAAVYFDKMADYKEWARLHSEWMGPKREFKFDRSTGKARTSFGSCALKAKWRWYSLVGRKEELTKPDWDPEDLYRRLFSYLINNIFGRLGTKGHSAVFDGRTFRGSTQDLFNDMVLGSHQVSSPFSRKGEVWEDGFITSTRYAASEQSAGVQLADFVAGATYIASRRWSSPRIDWRFLIGDRLGKLQVWPPS